MFHNVPLGLPTTSIRGNRKLLLGGMAAGCAAAIWTWRRFKPELALAPGWPGKAPHWTSSAKQAVGTAISPQANLWFTIHHGKVTEVFYPRADQPAIGSMQLIVTGPRGFYSEEDADAEHAIECPFDGVPFFRVINTCRAGRYRLEKSIFAHPTSPALLQVVRFVALRGRLEDYRLHVLTDPHLGNDGWHNWAWLGEFKGQPLLLAQELEQCAALGCSVSWRKRSVGYMPRSDGRRQLRRYGRLTQTYRSAPPGNAVLIGEIDHEQSGGEFVLALGFGSEPSEAGYRVRQCLLDDVDALKQSYVDAWQQWQAALNQPEPPEAGRRDLHRTSTMVLRAHEDKCAPGAFVASLSIPWGQAHSSYDKFGPVGYHVVWTRDLSMIAGGLLAAGDGGAALRALEYCRSTQQPDGSWPQNQDAFGNPLWRNPELGEISLPILLVDLIRRAGTLAAFDRRRFWPMIRAAASYLVRRGPSAEADRWEDSQGFTPFTLAAAIASLAVAAELAAEEGEGELGRFLLEMADAWHSDIDYWTYVSDTALARRIGVPGYYLRIAPPDREGRPMKYGGGNAKTGERSPAEIVSVDALAYVRFGLIAPDDPRIIDTVRVIDAELKTETPFGPSWHRYSHDAYGEKEDGSPFDGRPGKGRLWPLLTGERAHYELLAGRADEARRLLIAMESFAGEGKLLPEQVWDSRDIPSRELYLGRPSGSAMPLAWAHAEYIKLRRSLAEGRVYDLPPQTWQRYVIAKTQSQFVLWRASHRRRMMPLGRRLRILCEQPAAVHWSVGTAVGERREKTRDTGIGIHYADLPTEDLPAGDVVQFEVNCVKKTRSKSGQFPPDAGNVRIESYDGSVRRRTAQAAGRLG